MAAKDNKVRMSPDVLEQAQSIATEIGVNNPRVVIEAVFRLYAEDYRSRRQKGNTNEGLGVK